MEIYSVADYFKIDPGVVEKWDMVDFTDREEYMQIQLHLQNPKDEEPELWEGPSE